MKLDFNKEKSTEKLVSFAQNTTKIGKKMADGVKTGTAVVVEKTKVNAAAMVERTKNDAYARRLKKYNPLFPHQYNSEDFHLPNIVVIVDDAVRKDIDVCEGAIGWLGKENDVEILYHYDEVVPFSGIQFVPTATCDAAYYVDSFDRSRFIKADCYFKIIQDERSAELEHIACCLGAKWCSVEIIEKQKEAQAKKQKAEIKGTFKGVKNRESVEQSSSAQNATELHSRNYSEFQGNNVPQKPTLKWFANDNTIQQLITARCRGSNIVTKKDLEFYGSSFATMSQKAACAIDCAISGAGQAGGSRSMEAQATREQESRLIFHIEF